MILFIRQILFNIAFYGMTVVCCLVLLPFTLLPRKIYVVFLTMYFQLVHILEKYILGLDFEIAVLRIFRKMEPSLLPQNIILLMRQ